VTPDVALIEVLDNAQRAAVGDLRLLPGRTEAQLALFVHLYRGFPALTQYDCQGLGPSRPAVKWKAEEDGGRQQMMDPWGRELFLICLLTAFSSGLAWVLDHEFVWRGFCRSCGCAGSRARPR
jgi:hypothetical protein